MNYEQKYKEALERARKLHSEYRTIVGVNIPEEIFPELKESEDERIRKELIEQVAYIIPNDDEVDGEGDTLPTYQKRIDKYRAWLEKQGEKDKPKEWCAEDEQNLNVVLSFIPDECLRRWLKDKLSYDLNNKLDADKVIEWLNDQACLGWIEDIEVEKFVEQFRKDFGL